MAADGNKFEKWLWLLSKQSKWSLKPSTAITRKYPIEFTYHEFQDLINVNHIGHLYILRQFVLVAMNTHLPDKIHLDNAQTFALFSTKEIVQAIHPPGSQRHMGLGKEVINTHNYVRRHSKLFLWPSFLRPPKSLFTHHVDVQTHPRHVTLKVIVIRMLVQVLMHPLAMLINTLHQSSHVFVYT